MTYRLYYEDSYTTQFEATMLEHVAIGNRVSVVLDKTYFYPEGGGQPADTGSIGSQPVLDVQTRDHDSAVLHVLAGLPEDMQTVVCQIDWPRRFDHMQHHTGQHILTQAFIDVAQTQTIGFHLSENSVTIDLDQSDLSATDIHAAEQLANQIIVENRPVQISFIDAEEAAEIRMRRLPQHLKTDQLRIVDISDFDQTACGGTHVSATGEIGLLKIVKVEKHRSGSRVTFVCGRRAMDDYQARFDALTQVSQRLSTGYLDLADTVEKIQLENRNLKKSLKEMKTAWVNIAADQLVSDAAKKIGNYQVISNIYDSAALDLRSLASRLIQQPDVIVLLASTANTATCVFACSKGVDLDMKDLLLTAQRELPQMPGGGSATLAQAGGFSATRADIESAFQATLTQIEEA